MTHGWVELKPPEQSGAATAAGRATGDEEAVVRAEHTGVCLTRSWATATSDWLSPGREPDVGPRADACPPA